MKVKAKEIDIVLPKGTKAWISPQGYDLSIKVPKGITIPQPFHILRGYDGALYPEDGMLNIGWWGDVKILKSDGTIIADISGSDEYGGIVYNVHRIKTEKDKVSKDTVNISFYVD